MGTLAREALRGRFPSESPWTASSRMHTNYHTKTNSVAHKLDGHMLFALIGYDI